jgi:hypothetical protein
MTSNTKNELVRLEPQSNVSLDGLQDLFNPPRLSKPEMHLLLKPFFVLDRHADRFKPIDHITSTIAEGKATMRRWYVQPHSLYGLPGAFDRDVTVALYEIVNENYFAKNVQIPELMPIGSMTDFILRMGLAVSGKNISAVKESLKRLQNTLCTADETFFDNKKKRYVSLSFRLLRGVGFAGEDDGNGTVHDENFVIFDEAILKNLNSGYVMVLDVDSFRQLGKDITKQLYAHLAYRFYRASEEGLDHWIADYQWLAVHLGIKVLAELRRAKDQLKDAHEELKRAGYIADYLWDGWRIVYRPGRVWKGEQLRRHSGKLRRRDKRSSLKGNAMKGEPQSVVVEERDPLITTLVAFAANLPVAEDRLKALGLTAEQATEMCKAKQIVIRDR